MNDRSVSAFGHLSDKRFGGFKGRVIIDAHYLFVLAFDFAYSGVVDEDVDTTKGFYRRRCQVCARARFRQIDRKYDRIVGELRGQRV
jgi:hypothetical protein|tara:strand:- start:154 stop:414 length:261 start_codon:yes stop_codon:yes gene_type:complete